MAMAAVYTTINGMLVHESRGGVESFYFPDTLGNLTTVRSATGVKTYGAEYWPYGEIQTETGTNPSPWSFVGLLGYLRDTASRLYVRARHYRPGLARWQTVDPLWPDESAYGYANASPVYLRDPSGQACSDPCADDGSPVGGCIALFCSIKASFDSIKKALGLNGEWDKLIKKILGLIKETKDFDPSGCCKQAHSGGFPTSKGGLIAALIGFVCRSTKTKAPNPRWCKKLHPDDTGDSDRPTSAGSGCRGCCNSMFTRGTSLYATCLNVC